MKNDKRLEKIKEKCPLLFKEEPRSGFCIGDGWFPLVERLCYTIENQLKYYVPEEIRGEIYIAQVKEKFGTLRFYMNQSTPYIDGAIALAESLSFIICETCGHPASLRAGSYMQSLCDKHAEEKNAQNKKDLAAMKAESKARASKKKQEK